MENTKGYIYILTNPSFPDYVKIGYADNVAQRLQQLNQSECIPFAFRIYATYEVSSRLLDKKFHTIIDVLNRDLRSIDEINGKMRKREFFAMKPEEAYAIFEAMAEIHDCKDRLTLYVPTAEEIKAEELAEEIATETRNRSENFTFDEYQIPVGAVLEFTEDPSITCTVYDNRKVIYNGEVMYITPLMKQISEKKYLTKGPKYLCEHFKYKGILLDDIKNRNDT